MVYIRRIDLRGFKTFTRKATLKLDQGLTVITGPNGSGKSNILDALRFALGELSPKELRGASLSDLISKSTLQNPPRSVYVSVQFDNADRRIPIDSGIVTISREFYKGGEGVYRLNGRRVSRKQLTELLSAADISVEGYNIVPQHAITRLAEVTSEERRKIIEDLVGLGAYDLKKAEAQAQLAQADTNLKIASARVDEVRLRVESLERERNDYLRHSLLTQEIARLQARTISGKLSILRRDADALREQAGLKESRLNDMRSEREKISTLKLQLEQEMRNLQERLLDQEGLKISELERRLSEVNSRIASSKAEIEAKRLNLELIRKQKEVLEQEAAQHELEIGAQSSELLKLMEEGVRIQRDLDEVEAKTLQLSSQIQTAKETQTEFRKTLDEIEGAFNSAVVEDSRISPQVKAESAKIEVIEEELKTLRNREAELQKTLAELQERKRDLEDLRTRQEEKLSIVDRDLDRYTVLERLMVERLNEAAKTAESAGGSIIEFEAQRRAVDQLVPSQAAFEEIQELRSSGRLPNIIGRLRDLIRFERGYERAVKAACADWLDSIIVKDTATALECIEHLKRSKLSRIKIIPLDILPGSRQSSEIPKIEGVIKRAVDCVQFDPSIKVALDSLLGDALVAESQRAAYLASMEGFRATVTTDDLYEPFGMIEGGYYREPLDISSVAPRTRLLKDLKEAFTSLSRLIGKDRSDLETIRSRLEYLREEKIGMGKELDRILRDTGAIQERLNSTAEEAAHIHERVKQLMERAEEFRVNLQSMLDRKAELNKAIKRLEEERTSLRNKLHPAQTEQIQEEYESLTEALKRLREEKTIVSLRISSIKSSVESKQRMLERIKGQLRYIGESEEGLTSKLELASKELEDWSSKLSRMTEERGGLSRSLESLRQRRTEIQTELDRLGESLHRAEAEIEALSSDLTMLRLELNKKELEENYLTEELARLGFQKLDEPSPVDTRAVEENLSTLRRELQEIGAVNELAVAHYEEQKDNYKQLSMRINQLEEEKHSILRFMEELENKKRETFMSVFERLNRNFNEAFSKITDGGSGRLILENPEDVFNGGVDMQLAFPGKAELSIGSASGGEKSVATVCFLLALQTIHPMPFYAFDEIDAHLDMVNSQRLADLLRERSADSQFIVVSLKDTTISKASNVFGIFIQDGYSQVVSLPKPGGEVDVGA
ncbi:MAG: chromosome segregation protein SMC [Candidatus Bathyarchaeia archaeon]